MFNINDLPESKLEDKLTELQLLGTQLQIGGETLQVLGVQVGYFNPSAFGENQRIASIMCSGQNNVGSSQIYQDYNATISISGIADRSDAITARMIAHHFDKVLREHTPEPNPTPGQCGHVFGLVPTGIVGPFFEDTGRPVFEVGLRLMIS